MKSPLAPLPLTDLPVIDGVRYSAVEAGVRYKNRKDVALIEYAPGSVMAGVFTKSSTRSAPVLHCQSILGDEGANGIAIIVNSGNSNAFTGSRGVAAMEMVLAALGAAIGLPKTAIHMASTGVIGEVLPHEPIVKVVPALIAGLDAKAGLATAEAIMTTDTFAKGASAVVDLDGTRVSIAGFAKGSGMIAPDMATMLGFVASDVKIAQPLLQAALLASTEASFNAITVDSDTSTSDSVYLGATGRADMAPINDANDPRLPIFQAALDGVMRDLAHQIVKDGEGATKFITVAVTGAADDADARKVAMATANSPLVKTAVAGEDPNWGRLVMAVGKSGAKADRDLLTIRIGDTLVAQNGAVVPDYIEAPVAAYMKGDDIHFGIDLGLGSGAFTAWTCDFTKRYIEINADYRS